MEKKRNSPFTGSTYDSYASYDSGAHETHLTYDELFHNDLDLNTTCPDLYKLGAITTAPELRALQELENQTVANVCICAVDKNVCSRKNLYPLRNATCNIPYRKAEVAPCQTSYFNTKV
jgi:hypothetical protein